MVFPVDIYGVILEHKYYHPYDADHPKQPHQKNFGLGADALQA